MPNGFITDFIMEGPVPDEYSCDMCQHSEKPADYATCRICIRFCQHLKKEDQDDD